MSTTKKRPDPPGVVPPVAAKKPRRSPEPRQQSSLLTFFGKKEPNGEKLCGIKEDVAVTTSTSSTSNGNLSAFFTKKASTKQSSDAFTSETKPSVTLEPAAPTKADANAQDLTIPKKVPFDPKARWKVKNRCLIIRTIPKEEPRTKVAAFDMDGTLLVWRIAGWPSRFEHYELWNSSVITKFQELHDEGYKLVIFSNQGAIRSAVDGKKATLVKSLIEWLASLIGRPLHSVMSTDKKKGYHKPNPGMFHIAEQECNQGISFDNELHLSSYVGDSFGDKDPQGGVDEKFAQAVGEERGGKILKFHTPSDYFGPSAAEVRKKAGAMQEYSKPPEAALQQRAALLGGYLEGPLLLILAGVQGSGKSTFCSKLVIAPTKGECHWFHLSQDTIQKGKPGKRELVEEQTRQALKAGKSVVVDRMHLNEEQRAYFVAIGKECNVPVHAVLLRPPKEVVTKRVRERINHPGGVEGIKGARMAIASLERVVVPKYDEGFQLISCTGTGVGVVRLGELYRRVAPNYDSIPFLASSFMLADGVVMPSLTLGSMGIGNHKAQEVITSAVKLGWKAVDTAPTYKNEAEIARGFHDETFVTINVPKRATSPKQVRDELNSRLKSLVGRKRADLLLLRWPCDVLEAGTLKETWQEMEQCLSDDLCRSIGVSNFSVNALRQLIPHCKVLPTVNQVERHPLLPQLELLQFCTNHDIMVQAHTALGQGKDCLLENSVIVNVAKEAGLISAQVVLKWNLQHGVAVVLKCTSEEHLKQALFAINEKALTKTQMQKLDTITERIRFVAPPFMYKSGAAYSCEDRLPKRL